MEGEYGGQTYVGGGGNYLASPQHPGQSLASTEVSSSSRGGPARNSTVSVLPPLMTGSRLSVLSTHTMVAAPGMSGGVAPSCGPGGASETVKGEDEEGRWRDRQQAWVEQEQQGGGEPEEDCKQAFGFLAEDEMTLPDDRFEVG